MTNSLLDTIPTLPPPSELDELISRDPLDCFALDIDKMIALQRQHRARLASGTKVRKAKDDGPSEGIDLAKLGLMQQAPQALPTPSIVPAANGGGMRR
jgi:hypothetical protein